MKESPSFVGPGLQKNLNCCKVALSLNQCSFMSHDLDPFALMLFLMYPSAVVLSICIGVGG